MDINRAVNEPDEHERSPVHVRSFSFNRTNKQTRILNQTNFLVHVRSLKKMVVRVCLLRD